MLADPIEAPGDTSPTDLLATYASALAEAVDSIGVDAVVEATGLEPATVESIVDGDVDGLTVAEAAAILAVREEAPEGEAILAEVRDRLLLGMSSAMLSVDRIAADLDGDFDPKEVQGKIEGRHPMTVAEYARLHHYIARAQ